MIIQIIIYIWLYIWLYWHWYVYVYIYDHILYILSYIYIIIYIIIYIYIHICVCVCMCLYTINHNYTYILVYHINYFHPRKSPSLLNPYHPHPSSPTDRFILGSFHRAPWAPKSSAQHLYPANHRPYFDLYEVLVRKHSSINPCKYHLQNGEKSDCGFKKKLPQQSGQIIIFHARTFRYQAPEPWPPLCCETF